MEHVKKSEKHDLKVDRGHLEVDEGQIICNQENNESIISVFLLLLILQNVPQMLLRDYHSPQHIFQSKQTNIVNLKKMKA